MTRITSLELFGLGALLLTLALAWLLGDSVERRISVMVAVAWIGSTFLDNDASRTIQWPILAVDILLTIGLIAETIFGRKLWPVVATAAMFMIDMTHVGFLIDHSLVREAFFCAYYLWSYVVLAAIIAGSLLTTLNRRRAVGLRAEAGARPPLQPG